VITVQVNGKPLELEDTLTVQELIQKIQIPSPSVAVAVNSEIVPRSEFSTFAVKEQDRVEIVQAVGGG